MKALVVVLGAAALSGCMAYGPGYDSRYDGGYNNPNVTAPYVVQPGYDAGYGYGYSYGYNSPGVAFGGFYSAPYVYAQPYPRASYLRPYPRFHPRHPGWGKRDRDGDGIPNHLDRRPGRDRQANPGASTPRVSAPGQQARPSASPSQRSATRANARPARPPSARGEPGR